MVCPELEKEFVRVIKAGLLEASTNSRDLGLARALSAVFEWEGKLPHNQ